MAIKLGEELVCSELATACRPTSRAWRGPRLPLRQTFSPLTHSVKCTKCCAGPALRLQGRAQVVNEQYEELVFSEPASAFLDRVQAYQPGPALPTPAIAPYYLAFDPAGDVRRLLRARNHVASMAAAHQRQLDQLA